MSKYYSTGASKIMQFFKKLQLNFIVDVVAFHDCLKSISTWIPIDTGKDFPK